MTPPNHAVVAVIWQDASYTEDQVGEKDLEHNPVQVTTYGMLIKDDHQGLTLAAERVGPDEVRGLTYIPRPLVLQITPLRKREVVLRALRKPPDSLG